MGCPCEIALYTESLSKARCGFGIGETEAHRLDMKYSHYRVNSYLAYMQTCAAQTGGFDVDSETAALLNFAQTQFEISKGLFDITTRTISALWDRVKSIPGEQQIRAALERTGWGLVIWHPPRLEIPEGLTFDLGGIVKEYAVDRVAGLLLKAGFRSGYVDMGGDQYFLGPHPYGKPWKVGIQNPKSTGRPIALVDFYAGGVATSGDYERYSEIDGKRYGHIINPRTGWPTNLDPGGVSAISILGPSCLLAGSVSTLAMLLPSEESKSFLEQSGLHWLAIGTDQTISGTITH